MQRPDPVLPSCELEVLAWLCAALRRQLSLSDEAIDPTRDVAEYGLDSLGNLELRTRIETETGVRIQSTDITTVRGVADHLCETLAPTENATAPM